MPFRGVIVAAPLKPIDEYSGLPTPKTFRGVIVAAPLKRDCRMNGGHEHAPFRGVIVAAPLKQRERDGERTSAAGAFRGVIVAAPLKREYHANVALRDSHSAA